MKISIRSQLARRLAPFRRTTQSTKRPAGKLTGAAILAGGLAFLGGVSDSSGVELIQNGGFEMNNGFDADNSGFSWLNSDGAPVFDVYSHSSQVYYEGPAPTGAEEWYFHTVGVASSDGVYQDVQLTSAASSAEIDAGTVRFQFSGWLAGYTPQDDHPVLSVQFFDEDSQPIGGPTVMSGSEFGPGSGFVTTVTGADLSTFSNPIAAWKQYEKTGGAFIGARSARVSVLQGSLTGNGNDNYTDLVSFDVADTGMEQFLKLRVNTGNGAMALVNGTENAVDINYYEVHSGAGSLSVGGWNSFDDQGLDAIGAGPGQSWDEGGGSDTTLLVEAFLLGTSTFDTNESNTLGQGYNATINSQDLTFFYSGTDGQLLRGIVEYVTGISGDFDGNGVYECADIDGLIGEIIAGTNSAAFDLNGDGAVDLADRDAWLAEAGAAQLPSGNPYLLGDANLDGVVDVSDFGVWNGNKFTATGAWCLADFNADGVTDVSDFGVWNGNKFTSADGAVAVPEPGFVAWGFIALVGLGIKLRRSYLR